MDGFGVGTAVILNSGCMTHSSVFSPNGGLSKSLCMSIAVILTPLKYSQPMDFSKPWYATSIEKMGYLHLDVLKVLQEACTKHFWVSSGLGFRVNQGCGIPFLFIGVISDTDNVFSCSNRLMVLNVSPMFGLAGASICLVSNKT